MDGGSARIRYIFSSLVAVSSLFLRISACSWCSTVRSSTTHRTLAGATGPPLPASRAAMREKVKVRWRVCGSPCSSTTYIWCSRSGLSRASERLSIQVLENSAAMWRRIRLSRAGSEVTSDGRLSPATSRAKMVCIMAEHSALMVPVGLRVQMP